MTREDRRGYTVVHLVAGEVMPNLIASQVVDHMALQAGAEGEDRPSRVAIGFLEPVRTARGAAVRARLRELQARAPNVRIALLPYVSRFGPAVNARLLARRVRRLAGRGAIVFHCRTEIAGLWAVAFRAALGDGDGSCGIVLDVRGPLPEETVYLRGFDGTADADARALRDYHQAFSTLHSALAHAARVISVSPGMLDWLRSLGVSQSRLLYVPCCVSSVTHTPDVRRVARERLGLSDKLVVSYVGTITRYQHIEDGVLPFFAAMRRADTRAHLLALTNEPDRLRALAAKAGVPATAVTAMSVPQREVAELLAASDCGLLLRAPNAIGRFWQPTKLGEYLAAGVPVIVSRAVGTVDELIERHAAGLAVDVFGVTAEQLDGEARRVRDALASRGDAMRANALALCAAEFLWSVYLPQVRAAYRASLAW